MLIDLIDWFKLGTYFADIGAVESVEHEEGEILLILLEESLGSRNPPSFGLNSIGFLIQVNLA